MTYEEIKNIFEKKATEKSNESENGHEMKTYTYDFLEDSKSSPFFNVILKFYDDILYDWKFKDDEKIFVKNFVNDKIKFANVQNGETYD